jgi:hypothetical protein
MYCYKINNSYTVYVCTEYINDCIKASKRSGSSKKKLPYHAKEAAVKMVPLAMKTKVSHKVWGNGTLVAKESHGIMTIAFSDRLVKFIYPDAFAEGHLIRV